LYIMEVEQIVEKMSISTLIVKQMLERLGYRVTSCLNSLEALEIFRQDPDAFDLVVTDMTMPHMTGDQLTHELTSIKPTIPVIICTGFSERINEATAATMGIKGYLMKPVAINKMAYIVRNVLDGILDRTPDAGTS